jgi:hypothetical protein
MPPRSALSAGTKPRDEPAMDVDEAKAIVMACVGELVVSGSAESRILENGDICLCFSDGATFLLAETMITRLA